MLKNKKNLLIIFFIVGVVLIGVGYYILFHFKELPLKEKIEIIKPVVINNSFVAKVGDSLLVSDGKKYGYYDFKGKKKIDINYVFDEENYLVKLDARDDLFVVTDDGVKYGVINASNKEIIPEMYMAVKIASKGCYLVLAEDSLWYVVDANNNKIIDKGFVEVKVIENLGVILTTSDNKFNIIDLNGKLLSNDEYVYISNYFESDLKIPVIIGQYENITYDVYAVQNKKLNTIKKIQLPFFVNEKYVFYTLDGKSHSSYNVKTGKIKNNVEVDFYINGMSKSIKDELLGYENSKGKLVIEHKYQLFRSNNFTEFGLVVVGLNDLYGVLDKEGNEVLPIEYKDVTIFSEKIFAVLDESGKNFYLVNDKKEKLFDTVAFKKNIDDLLVVYKDEKCGIINNYGKTLFDAKYSYCEIYNGAAVVADTNNQWQILKSS